VLILALDASTGVVTVAIARAGEGRREVLAEISIPSRGASETLLPAVHAALDLAGTELERRRTLHERQTASQTAVDQAEEALLQRRQRVQEIENQLRLIPAQRRIEEAARAVAEAQLAEARRSIARTVIRMPFDGRIAEVDVEREQFVSAGQVMLVAEAIARAEVSARLRLDQLEALIGEGREFRSVADLSASEIDAVALGLGIEAELRLALADRTITWPARLDRVSFALDPQTRTIGIVVAVDDPFRQAVLGERPPLVRDMFVEVVLTGPPRHGSLVVPREALRRDEDGGWIVHLVDDQDRLERRRVRIGPAFGNIVLVREGLAPGDRVVLSEIPVAVEEMKLAPVPDEAAAARLAARGDAP
jgi:membrane fusion protein, multidrug efflux system